jgi:hypothetical protein
MKGVLLCLMGVRVDITIIPKKICLVLIFTTFFAHGP